MSNKSPFMPEEKQISGFMGHITDVKAEADVGSQTANSQESEIDLVAMARWCQNYLANNPMPEYDWQCRFSLWGLHMPVLNPWPSSQGLGRHP